MEGVVGRDRLRNSVRRQPRNPHRLAPFLRRAGQVAASTSSVTCHRDNGALVMDARWSHEREVRLEGAMPPQLILLGSERERRTTKHNRIEQRSFGHVLDDIWLARRLESFPRRLDQVGILALRMTRSEPRVSLTGRARMYRVEVSAVGAHKL